METYPRTWAQKKTGQQHMCEAIQFAEMLLWWTVMTQHIHFKYKTIR